MSMDFDDQLKQAIRRGKQLGDRETAERKAAQLSKEEIRNQHNHFRLQLSEFIETKLKSLTHHFPGFDYETIYGERGWGGAVRRDDLRAGGPKYSRLEIVVRPLNEFHVVNILGKGTIANRELLNWNHFEGIDQAKMEDFERMIDSWVLQFAEQFAAIK